MLQFNSTKSCLFILIILIIDNLLLLFTYQSQVLAHG